MIHRNPTAGALTLTLALLPALAGQRDQQVLKAKGGTVTVDYGVVIVGEHGLHELQTGRTWRMGQGDASKIVTLLPLLSGETLIEPGTHTVQIRRAGDADLRLAFGNGRGGFGARRGGDGAGRRPGGDQDGGDRQGGGTRAADETPRQRPGGRNEFPGKLIENKKPTKKLALAWSPIKKAARDGVKPATLEIQFGKHRLEVAVEAVQATRKNARKWQALGFTYPLDVFESRRDAGIVALSLVAKSSLKKNKPLVGYNVRVGADFAEVVPMAAAPAARGRGARGAGRGGRAGRDAGQPAPTQAGSVEWSDQQATDAKTVVVRSVKAGKKDLTFEVLAGARLGKVTVPLPTPPK